MLPHVSGAASNQDVNHSLDSSFYEDVDRFLSKKPPSALKFKFTCAGVPSLEQLKEERRNLKMNRNVSSYQTSKATTKCGNTKSDSDSSHKASFSPSPFKAEKAEAERAAGVPMRAAADRAEAEKYAENAEKYAEKLRLRLKL